MKKIIALFIACVLLITPLTALADQPVYSDSVTLYRASGASRAIDSTAYAAFETRLCEAADQLQTSVDLAGLSISGNDIQNYYIQFLYTHPEYFYLSNSFSYALTGDQTVVLFNPSYTMGADTVAAAKAELNHVVADIAGSVSEGMPKRDIALVLHDYIVLNCAYDNDVAMGISQNPNAYTAYGCLVEGLSVCEGYSRAYQLLLREFDIPCYLVSSEAMAHMWNMIQIGGEYYHVDLTWDDALYVMGDSDDVYDVNGYVLHDYFMLTDAQMLAKDHYGWQYAPGNAQDDVYTDAFYDVSVISGVFDIDGYQYYLYVTGEIMKRDPQTGDVTTIFELPEDTYVEDGKIREWTPDRATLGYNGTDLCFNTATAIYKLNLETAQASLLCEPDIEEGYIVGFSFEGFSNTIIYDTRTAGRFTDNNVLTISTNYGDLNGDQSVNAKDLMILRKHLAGYTEQIDLNLADVYQDNKVNLKDCLLLRQFLADWDVALGEAV